MWKEEESLTKIGKKIFFQRQSSKSIVSKTSVSVLNKTGGYELHLTDPQYRTIELKMPPSHLVTYRTEQGLEALRTGQRSSN